MGRFGTPVRVWSGATQGHEVIGLRQEGLKFEALGFDMIIAASRVRGAGRCFADGLADLAHWAHWGAAVRAEAQGRIVVRGERVGVRFSLTRRDMCRVRRGIAVLGEMLLAAGAEVVEPHVHGFDACVRDPRKMRAFAETGTLRPRAYSMAATHLFGTCRMGSDPGRSVVGPDFQHHWTEGLYVADSAVFPSNTGVNPQTSILAMATLCAQRILG